MTPTWIDATLAEQQAKGRERQLRNLPSGLLNFCSNDILGLSRHPALVERACEYTRRYGTGATASRLVCGNLDPYATIEEKLALLMRGESALLFNSGYQMNVSLIPALADRTSTIFIDRYAHNSLVQGSLLSRAHLHRFQHNDLDHLARLLAQSGPGRKLVITESLFSMDGDRADLEALKNLCVRYDAMLYVDDAHGFGVYGPHGGGLAADHPDITCRVVGFGKAAGAFGGAVCCSEKLKRYFIQTAGGLIYSTALPPAALGAIEASIELIPELHKERQHVQTLAEHCRTQLAQAGWSTEPSTSHILPLRVGESEQATALAHQLEAAGILLTAIRPPTVPEGQARLRLALTATHTFADCQRLLAVLPKTGAA